MNKKNNVFMAIVVVGMCLVLLILRPDSSNAEVKNTSTATREHYNSHRYESITHETVEVEDREISLMAHLLMGECGASYTEDEMLYLTGTVVLNRVESEYFPDTIEEVIYQKGQYACVDITTSGFYKEPTERCWKIAEELLLNGYEAPANVLYQAEFTQGKVYKKIQNMYFCYGKED